MTSSLQTLIGHGQGTTKVPQATRPQNQIETGWKSAWEGAHRSLSVRQKLRNIGNCSRRRREGHNSREGLQFTNSLSRRESYQEKSLPSQIPEGGLMQRIKDRRLKILQHLQRSQEGGVTDLAGGSTRQVVKHRGSRGFRQHRAEDCRNHRPIPQNCGYRQLIRCPKPEEKIRKIGKRRPIDGMAFRGTPPPINGPFSVVPCTKRRAPNQSRLFSHMPEETT